MVCVTSKASDQPALEYSMTVKLLTQHHFEFLSLKGDCTGLSESTLVKMPHCWKSHLTALFTCTLYRRLGGHVVIGRCVYAYKKPLNLAVTVEPVNLHLCIPGEKSFSSKPQKLP